MSNKKSLWSDGKSESDIEFFANEDSDKVIFNLQEDIKCLKEELVELKEKAESALSDLAYLLNHQKTNLVDGSQLADGQAAHELWEALRK